MNRLYLIRHSKSSWKDFSLDDYDRPLNKRGKRNSIFMGKLLNKKEIKPSIIISSPALRATKSAVALAKEIDYNIEDIIFDTKIYEASLAELIQKIKSIDSKDNRVFLIGHNPSINQLLDYLVSENKIYNVVTSGVVELEFDCKWSEIDRNIAKLISYEYPKKYLEIE